MLMRRLARGCISESHPLYGTFMAKLSSCIYEWDEEDYTHLMNAKSEELIDPTSVHERSSQSSFQGRVSTALQAPKRLKGWWRICFWLCLQQQTHLV